MPCSIPPTTCGYGVRSWISLPNSLTSVITLLTTTTGRGDCWISDPTAS